MLQDTEIRASSPNIAGIQPLFSFIKLSCFFSDHQLLFTVE
jgi:hypothetical protein